MLTPCLFGLLIQLLVLLAISKALLPFTHEAEKDLLVLLVISVDFLHKQHS